MSQTDYLKLNKHDDVQNNTEAFDIENYLNGNWDKIDTNAKTLKDKIDSISTKVNENTTSIETNNQKIQSLETDNETNKQDISNIKSEQETQNTSIENIETKNTEQDTKLVELQEENKKLRSQIPSGQAEGECITLNDSSNLEFEEFVISGNSKQEVTEQGKNLLDSSKYKIDSSNVTYKNGEFTIENISFFGYHGVNFDLSFLKPSTKYTLSLEAMVSKGTRYAFRFINNSEQYLDTIFGTETEYTQKTVTFSTPSDVSKFELCLHSHIIYNATDKTPIKGEEIKKYRKICIKEGTDTTYEPFVPDSPSIDYPSEIECVSSTNVKVCNKNIEDNEFEIGSIDSTTGELTESNWNLRNKNFIRIKPNQKYIMRAVEYSGIKLINTGCRYYDRNKKYLGTYFVSDLSGGKKEFTITDENVAFCKFIHLNSEEIPSNYTLKIQLEEDNETDYVEHEEQNYPVDMQEPFRAIGDIRDTFIKKNNKWYERHYIKRLILNGTETYGSYTNTKGLLVCYLTSSNLPNYKQGDLKSNYFTETKTIIEEENKNCIYANTNNIQFINTNVTTIEEFKEWITEKYNAGTPVYVDYLLVEPIDIECTAQQSEILDEIDRIAHTYKNTTHIFSTDEISPVIDVTYKKDLDTLFNKI